MLPQDQDKELLTTRDIAQYLSYHIETVRLYIKHGQLPAMKVGREYRILREDFEKFLEERKVTQPSE
jgi:excisionase family DNA binding protein